MRAQLATTLLLLCASAGAAAGAGAPALEAPGQAILDEAGLLVQAMEQAERGPYLRLRWFCADGSVLPPKSYACAERGGGVQHAEFTTDRERLAQLGYRVGTILTAMSWEELFDEGERHDRLRELSLERYLRDVEDGWVMRKARNYRGHVQIEDEERVGQEMLIELLSRPSWLAMGTNWLLARESVRVMPHRSGAGDRTREVRRLSEELADADESFLPLRIRIHTSPGPDTLRETSDWIAARSSSLSPETRELAGRVEASLAGLYGAGELEQRLAAAERSLQGETIGEELRELLGSLNSATTLERLTRLSDLLELVRRQATTSDRGETNLLLVDLSIEAESALRSAAFELLATEVTPQRRELLAEARALVRAAHGTGLLSTGERDSLVAGIDELAASQLVKLADYRRTARALERAGSWSVSSVRHAFAEPLARYQALEPAAARFPDDLIRGSAIMPLAEVAGRLARDAERLDGVRHRVAGTGAEGAAGLNPGIALGPLKVIDEAGLRRIEGLSGDEIAVLPRTVPELPPVAGILSLAEGNVVSHVQVLARNLGIPNANLPSGGLDALRAMEGRRVLLAVSGEGAVVLIPEEEVPADLLARLSGPREGGPGDEPVLAPIPDLGVARPLPLTELHGGLSGRVVGPKAANLGELAKAYPEAVAAAVAIPFGIFAEHALAGSDPPKLRLERAFALHRRGEIDDASLKQEVEEVRRGVNTLHLRPEVRAAIEASLEQQMGPSGSYGVFVRSDTNVEDLPGFTGAGLNTTLPNLVGIDNILAGVPTVWASPFRERPMRWRARALKNPEEVYPSVLIMKSVQADKSGVLVTRDLISGGEGLTVATAWGVGGAVDGEEAETLILRPDGRAELMSEAKAPWKRALPLGGGVSWVPADSGPVLTASEQGLLRELAASLPLRLPEALAKQEALDVEFGFVEGRLALFQVRPLVERGAARADALVAGLLPPRGERSPFVDLALGVDGVAVGEARTP